MIQEQVRAWKQLKEMVAKVEDPTLRNAMMAEFRNRAINEWGYCPDDRNAARNDIPVLDSWERDLLDDIKKAQTFGLDINYIRKDKHAVEQKELEKNMYFFIKDGGSLADIPPEIRTDTVVDAYLRVLKKMYYF
jgi:hypothetical protein